MAPAPEASLERCTVILTPRDLFSVAEECLAHLFANTPEPFDLIVALGGAPEEVDAEHPYGHHRGMGLRTAWSIGSEP